ncbi:nitroreductase family protein [Chengkuizengella axinellae]|uniref:Nitroreductase family protein n=1 Tax=Chengkuizengella axinellae TaxID=3064388 RepID=A0ABT9J6X9_9BACL|nr:nitroreductase family protein [Chengkuizengella sp. 2205SS18-9]MDP5276780.1 nitroreductase family protein [Chengkuizengella sp. 2205SS18-9]
MTQTNEEYLNKVQENKNKAGEPKELTDQNFFTVAKERSSVRFYDASFKMEESEINEILETAILAPSSSNLQPWRFLVINDQELKEKLLPIAANQQQVVDSSAVIAVLGDTEAYKHAEAIYGNLVKVGAIPEETKDFYVNQINSYYGSLTPEEAIRVVMIDGGIVSSQLMLAAKAKGYDTVPMGGFNKEQFIEAFNLPENLSPVMLIALGKADKAGFPKNRLPLEEVTTWNTF